MNAPLPNDPKRDCETVTCANCDSEVHFEDATEFGLDNICNGCLPVDCRATAWLQQAWERMEKRRTQDQRAYEATIEGFKTENRNLKNGLRIANTGIEVKDSLISQYHKEVTGMQKKLKDIGLLPIEGKKVW